MTGVYLYQIYYDQNSKAALDRGFLPLDNTAQERPDWREYYPIRKYLLGNRLQEGAYYGFFSWRLAEKTGLTSADIQTFIKANLDADVAVFCPTFDQSAFFLNVFEQGNLWHPGLMEVAQRFVDDLGLVVDLRTLVMDSTNTVFANYFAAKRPFWIAWLDMTEKLYYWAETSQPGLSGLFALNLHRGESLHHKVFLLERLASLILATDHRFKTAVYDPRNFPVAVAALSKFRREAVVCDALKLAYRRLNNRRYLDEFLALRKHVLGRQRQPANQ